MGLLAIYSNWSSQYVDVSVRMRQMKHHYFKKHGHNLIYVVNMSITRHWKCHLGKQRHIGHSYKSPESDRQYINQPPPAEPCWKRAANAAELVASWLPDFGKEHCSLQMENSSALKHWNTEFLRVWNPHIWSTDYAKIPSKKNTQKVRSEIPHFAVGNLGCRAAFQIQWRERQTLAAWWFQPI